MDQWVTIAFSLTAYSRCTFIWTEAGTRYLSFNINRYGSRGLMFCAGIMWLGRTLLRIFKSGTVTDVKYRDVVLETYVCLFRGTVRPDLILMDDNTRPHEAHLVDDFQEREDIHWIDWPARSEHIKHVSKALGMAITTCNPPPKNH